ncbi:MAG: hypothetical protein K2M27_00855 [Muribaculaceae bacterium]|nr:hypothetical protein [Muribaculaceae bacterium]
MSFVIDENDDYEKVYNAYANAGEKVARFSGIARSGSAQCFNEGDIIILPDRIEPIKVPVGTSGRTAELIIVKVKSGSREQYMPFYPTTLAKRIFEIEVDADKKFVRDLDPCRPLGTAAEFYQSRANQSIQSIMEEMVKMGKKIKVSEARTVYQFAYGTTDVQQTRQYTFDFV